jgi:hypothetical protein
MGIMDCIVCCKISQLRLTNWVTMFFMKCLNAFFARSHGDKIQRNAEGEYKCIIKMNFSAVNLRGSVRNGFLVLVFVLEGN